MKVKRPRLVANPKRVAKHSRVFWLSMGGFAFSSIQLGMSCLVNDPPIPAIPFAVATSVVSLAAAVLPFLANAAAAGDQS